MAPLKAEAPHEGPFDYLSVMSGDIYEYCLTGEFALVLNSR